jgi:hypothetical protein
MTAPRISPHHPAPTKASLRQHLVATAQADPDPEVAFHLGQVAAAIADIPEVDSGDMATAVSYHADQWQAIMYDQYGVALGELDLDEHDNPGQITILVGRDTAAPVGGRMPPTVDDRDVIVLDPQNATLGTVRCLYWQAQAMACGLNLTAAVNGMLANMPQAGQDVRP